MQIAISVQFAYKSHYPRNANRCYHRTFTLSIKESAWNIYDKRPPSSVQRDGRDYSLGCEEGVDSPQWTAHSATIKETVKDCRTQSRDSQKNCQGQSRNSSSDQPVLVSILSTSDCLASRSRPGRPRPGQIRLTATSVTTARKSSSLRLATTRPTTS